jgi:hypothetical protein
MYLKISSQAKYKNLIVYFAFLLAGLNAEAIGKLKIQGAVDGGGGKVVVCKNVSGAIASVQLLDLWEAKTLYDLPSQTLGSTLRESVDQAVLALKNSYPLKVSMGRGNGKECTNQDCVAMILNETADLFFGEHKKMKRLRGVELTKTDDSYELAKPDECEIQQAVNYRPDGTILVDQDLFEKMSLIDQTALIAHEAYYSFLREGRAPETNSIRTRRAIGYIMSGQIFNLPLVPAFTESLLCHADGIPYAPTNIFLYRDFTNENGKFLSVFIDAINGSRLIGEKQPLMSFSFGEDSERDLFSGICSKEGMVSMIRFSGGGHVEFDHKIQLEWICKDQKVSVYLTETKPGDSAKTSELRCVAGNGPF